MNVLLFSISSKAKQTAKVSAQRSKEATHRKQKETKNFRNTERNTQEKTVRYAAGKKTCIFKILLDSRLLPSKKRFWPLTQNLAVQN